MPNIIGQFCTAFISGLLITSTSIATPGVTDAGQYSNTCEQQTCDVITHPQQDTSGTLPASIVECATGTDLCYSSGYMGNLSGHRKTSCTSCPSGYELKEVSGVSTKQRDCRVTYNICVAEPEDPLENCPSNCKYATWTTDTSQVGRQKRCNTTNGKCEYRCIPNFYDASALTGGTYCRPCPDNVLAESCSGYDVEYGTLCCERGYYMQTEEKSTSSGGIIIGTRYYDVTCPRCPSLGGVYGTTPINQCVNSVTACYIPANTSIRDTVGTYQFTSNCRYTTTGTSTGTITPVQPGTVVGTN